VQKVVVNMHDCQAADHADVHTGIEGIAQESKEEEQGCEGETTTMPLAVDPMVILVRHMQDHERAE